MYLDTRTVIIINIFSAGLLGLALLAVSQGYLKQLRVIFRWSLVSLLYSLSWLLYGLGLVKLLPPLIALVAAQGAMHLALAFFYLIIADFTGKPAHPKFAYIVVAFTLAGLSYYFYIVPDYSARVVVVSVAASILLYAPAWLLLGGKEKRPASHWFTGLVFLTAAVASSVRGVDHLIWPMAPNSTVDTQTVMQSMIFLVSYITSAMITFGFLLMSYDRYITQHEKAEEEIIESEMRLNEAQKLAKVGSWEFDFDTNELKWSKEQYHIFEMEEAPPDQLFELCRQKIHPDDLSAMDEAIRIGREKGQGVVYEHRVICKDGSVKYLLGIGETFKGYNGKRNMLRGTVQDITERKRAEETSRKFAILESKSKEMEQFAYIASHDLREPLLTIKNYIDLFSDEYKGKLDGDSDEYLFRISRAASRMDELMKGLLDYSRLRKMKELQPVDCNEVLKQVMADLNLLIDNTQAVITSGELPVLKTYPLEIKQLFQNLLTNALKFRKKETNPHISITANKQNGVWTFKFADNGIGIEATDHEKIFGLFQRLHNRNQYQGSGIGLAYCKKIVELHHGTIWVKSEPGVGSEFYFTIIT